MKSLSPKEVEERALFAFEACRVMRERIVPTDVFEHYGFGSRRRPAPLLGCGPAGSVPQSAVHAHHAELKKVGLLPSRCTPKYEELGLMQFAGLANDGDIDWVQMSRPLPGYDQDGEKIPAVSGFFGNPSDAEPARVAK